MRLRTFFVLATLAAAEAVCAHDLYLMPARFRAGVGQTVAFGIHNGDAFPASEVSPVVERLRDARLHSASGVAEARRLRVDGKRATGVVPVPGLGDLILTVRTIPNFIELEPGKFAEYLKEEGLGEIIDWRAPRRIEQAGPRAIQ